MFLASGERRQAESPSSRGLDQHLRRAIEIRKEDRSLLALPVGGNSREDDALGEVAKLSLRFP